jgi:AcrR family transcriptional regulator
MRIAQDHRAAILKTAARLFASRPFQQVLMDDIAAEVGIAKGTIYRFYPNKQELCVAICMEYMQTMLQELSQIKDQTDSHEEQLKRMVVKMAEHFHEYRDFFTAMHRAEGGIQLMSRKPFIKERSSIRDAIADVLRAGQRAGDWAGLDPIMCADMILGMMRNLYFFGEADLKPVQVSGIILNVLLNGIRTRTNHKHSGVRRAVATRKKQVPPMPARTSAQGGRNS